MCIAHRLGHSSLGGHLGYFHNLAIANNAASNRRVNISFVKLVFSFSLVKYPIVELLDHKVSQLLIFWGAPVLFSVVAASVYNSTNSVWGFPFSPSSPTPVIFVILILAILIGIRWYLSVVLICISLRMMNIEYLFMCLLAICISSLVKCLFKFSAHILNGFFFWCWGKYVLSY